MSRVLIACTVLVLLGCQQPLPEVPGKPIRLINVWIEDDPAMPAATLLEGCAYWRPLGFDCRRVKPVLSAQIRVRTEGSDCNADKPREWLARAHHEGLIEMHLKCFDLADRARLRTMTRVFAHEIGHELGIWDHVPSSCDPKGFNEEKKESDKGLQLKTSKDGKPVCGKAVMNPQFSDQPFLTDADRRAFELHGAPGFDVSATVP